MNIIIAGDGRVGSTPARQLSAEGYSLTLIDSNNSVLKSSMERTMSSLSTETVPPWQRCVKPVSWRRICWQAGLK